MTWFFKIPDDIPRQAGVCDWCCKTTTVYAYAAWVCQQCLEEGDHCRVHGTQRAGHFPCRVPGETASQFTARMFGETRDV